LSELLIKNGYVYDPINNINGEVMDIAVKNGKIVDVKEIDITKAKVIDAKDKVVMPGGVDIHAHVAGPKVNMGRVMRPEDHYKSFMKFVPSIRRSGSGRSVPSTTITGYRYARMGWTTVIEPASPPLKTRHTHDELNDIPIVDKAALLLMDANWFIFDYLENKDYDRVAAFVAWILDALKCYAVKLVDPGEAESWSWGIVGLNFDEQIPGRNLTPRDIVTGLAKVNEMLNLPHSIHVHCNKLGEPGNYETTIKTMHSVRGIARSGRKGIHVTHVQFSSYMGSCWADLRSASEKIAKYVNAHEHASIDMGQVCFGDTTTMTADADFEFTLFHLAKWKWSNMDVELECAAGIVPFNYKPSSYVHATQWAIGLETALLIKDPWKIVLSTDHPNAAPFTKYPRIIAWLMSKKARDEVIAKISRKAAKRLSLPAIDREMTLYEIAVMTRAAPAKLLGLSKFKGHLGVGADADIAIYDLNPAKLDLSKDYKAVVKAFRRAAYTIKDGEVVVVDGEVVNTTYGKTFYVKAEGLDEKLVNEVVQDISAKFKERYSVCLENYVIGLNELRRHHAIQVQPRRGRES